MNKEKYVYSCVAELSARLGMPAPEVLIVGVHDNAKDLIGKRYLGCAYQHDNRIVLRTRGLSLRSLKHTVAHELIHLRFKKLQHGIRFEEYIQALLRGQLAFDGHGLITAVTKPAPTLSDEAVNLLARQKRIDTKIKRLTTARKKIVRRLNFLKRKAGDQT
jgi:hypothetical protein